MLFKSDKKIKMGPAIRHGKAIELSRGGIVLMYEKQALMDLYFL
jgi:hypothetical protein